MKGTLEYDLPEEEHLFLAAINGNNYLQALLRIQQRVRDIRKYEKLTRSQTKKIDEIYLLINEEMSDLQIPE